MRFSDYLDVIYVNKNIELQQEFILKKQAETRAVGDLINGQRKFYKLIAYFTLTFGFFKAKLTNKWPERMALPKKEATLTSVQPLREPTHQT